jgi:hypothetical protein
VYAGAAFIDPSHGHIHTAFNPTDGETVVVASFLERHTPYRHVSTHCGCSDAVAVNEKPESSGTTIAGATVDDVHRLDAGDPRPTTTAKEARSSAAAGCR